MRELRRIALGCLVLALTACANGNTGMPASQASNAAILDDHVLALIKRGETKKDQVRSMIGAPTLVNYQAGNEVWIYQSSIAPSIAVPTGNLRTLTLQYDQLGVVRNIGMKDMPVTVEPPK
jgi:outer membrane protein assembly factor BamE (lipoprotein component of BamABCDE complex)